MLEHDDLVQRLEGVRKYLVDVKGYTQERAEDVVKIPANRRPGIAPKEETVAKLDPKKAGKRTHRQCSACRGVFLEETMNWRVGKRKRRTPICGGCLIKQSTKPSEEKHGSS